MRAHGCPDDDSPAHHGPSSSEDQPLTTLFVSPSRKSPFHKDRDPRAIAIIRQGQGILWEGDVLLLMQGTGHG